MIRCLAASTEDGSRPDIAPIDLERLPGTKTLITDLLRELGGIASQCESFLGHHSRGFMVAVTISGTAMEAGDENQRSVDSNDPNDIP